MSGEARISTPKEAWERTGDGRASLEGGRPSSSVAAAGAGGHSSRSSDESSAPPVPETLEDAGLGPAFVSELLLKSIYRGGALMGRKLADRVRLPFGLLDPLLLDLQRRHLVEVHSSQGHGRQTHVFDLTKEGKDRAQDAIARSRYVGPAPVPFDAYVSWLRRQSVRGRDITPEEMRQALGHLVLEDSFIDAVGAAANSGTALFLYGSPGNGKTAVAQALARIFDDSIYVPHAVVVEGGTIIQVHDPVFHEPAAASVAEAEQQEGILRPPPPHDQRFARIRRPAVTVGGELTMGELELQLDAQAGVYRAPVQLKANGGVFILDDFGRQRIPARDLLNRWMVPLEEHQDYLALPTGHKLPVPFDCFLVFSTNLNPTDLVEEAFLRRLRYKVPAIDPSREQFAVILRRCCEAQGLEFAEATVDLVYDNYYERTAIEPRACHPRDLVAHIIDEARYRGEVPELTLVSMDRACRTYFLELPAPGGAPDGDAARSARDADS